MIHQALHRQPVAVDRDQLRNTKLKMSVADLSFCAHLNTIFVAATEFGDACRDMPLVFIDAGLDEQGKKLVAPVAVMGVTNGDNLFVEGNAWRGRYMPAVLRTYPFCTARIDDERFAVCVDNGWKYVNTAEGEPLFTEDGKPTPFLEQTQKQLEVLETEILRTRVIGQRLLDLELLRDMRFDAEFGDGRKHSVDGFLTIDQERLAALPDATVLELHKSGILGLIHQHWISMGNMRFLFDWHVARNPVAPATPAVQANGAA